MEIFLKATIILFLLSSVIGLACCQISCAGTHGCVYFQCLTRYSEQSCGALEENAAGEAVYFCKRIMDAESDFDFQGFQAIRQALTCSIDKLQMRTFRKADLCNNFADIIANAFDKCFSNIIHQTVSNCQNVAAITTSIFSTEVLTLKYARLLAIQYWNNLISKLNSNMLSLPNCSNLDQAFQTSLELELKDCVENNIDSEIVILLDSSDSIGSTMFNKMVLMTLNLIRRLPTHVKVGVVRYSNNADIILSLDDSTLLSLENAKYIGGRTSTDVAIHRAISLFSPSNDPCKNIKRFMLIMTDGKSNHLLKSMNAANVAKQQHNVHLYCLAIGKDVHERELRELASKPVTEYIYRIMRFEDDANVNLILSKMQDSFCKSPTILNFGHCTTLELLLNKAQSQVYRLHTLPSRFTLQVTTNGTVGVFGSFTRQNPHPITADIVMEGSVTLQHHIISSQSELILNIVSLGSSTAQAVITKNFYDTSVGLLKGPSSILEADYGSSAELQCSAETTAQLTFIWRQSSYGIADVTTYYVSTNGQYSIVNDTLMLFNITSNQEYRCTVASEGHIITSQEAIITIKNLSIPAEIGLSRAQVPDVPFVLLLMGSTILNNLM